MSRLTLRHKSPLMAQDHDLRPLGFPALRVLLFQLEAARSSGSSPDVMSLHITGRAASDQTSRRSMGDVVWGTDFNKGRKVESLTELANELIRSITEPLYDTTPCEYLAPTDDPA